MTVYLIYRELRLHYLTLYHLWTVPCPHHLQLPLSLFQLPTQLLLQPRLLVHHLTIQATRSHTIFHQVLVLFQVSFLDIHRYHRRVLTSWAPPQSLPMNFGALPMSNDKSNSFMSPPFIPPSMPLSVQSQFSPPGVQQVHN